MFKRFTLCFLAAAMAVPVLASTAVAKATDATVVNVRAVDYDFKGIPAELKTEWHRFNFENRGDHTHELIVVRKRGWVNKSWEQILRMRGEEAERRIQFIGHTFAKPGQEGKHFGAYLRAGKYLAVCFAQNDRHSKPHAFKGMLRKFHVVKA